MVVVLELCVVAEEDLVAEDDRDQGLELDEVEAGFGEDAFVRFVAVIWESGYCECVVSHVGLVAFSSSDAPAAGR